MENDYVKKTLGSKKAFEKAKKFLAGGQSHNARFFNPYPFSTVKAQGKYLWDVDGNRYCDYWMGHTALILGHSPKPVVQALRSQIGNGTHFGTTNLMATELAERLSKCMKGAELTRFCCSGAEATMYAVRLTRAYTGKRIIFKIEGGWHGYNPVLHKAVTSPFEEPESAGLMEEEQAFVKPIPFNDVEAAVTAIRKEGQDLAGVMLEPVLGAGGCIAAEPEYLKTLREETEKTGALLIFDEVITGFRLALGGAQERYNVSADIFTLGKILGGGMPIGAVSGRREILQLASPLERASKSKTCRIGGGTFSDNPLTMTAGIATLDYLIKNKHQVYGKLEEMGSQAKQGVEKAFRGTKLRTATTGMGSLLVTHFLNPSQDNIRNARDNSNANKKTKEAFYLALLAYHNIFFLPGHMGAISASHSTQDIQTLIKAASKLAEDTRTWMPAQ